MIYMTVVVMITVAVFISHDREMVWSDNLEVLAAPIARITMDYSRRHVRRLAFFTSF